MAVAATAGNAVLAALLFNNVIARHSDASAVVFCLISGTLSVLAAWYIVRAWRARRESSEGLRRGVQLVAVILALVVDVAVFAFVVMMGLVILIGPTVR